MESKCSHFFILGKEKEHTNALDTHSSYCKYCQINYFKYSAKLISSYYKNPHLKLTKQEKEKIWHIHVWELVSKISNHIDGPEFKLYHCISNVTDWNVSTDEMKIQVKCLATRSN